MLAIVLGLAVSSLSSVLVLIVLALFIALGLDPVVRSLEGRGVPRGWAIVVVSGGLVAVLVGVLGLVIPAVASQLVEFVRSLPAAIDAFMESQTYAALESNFGDGLTRALDQIEALLTDPATLTAVGGGVLQFGAGLIGGISAVLIVFVLTLYFIASLGGMKSALYRLSPAWSRPRVESLTERITLSVGAYLKGMVILAFLNSVFSLVLHLVLGLPFPVLMAVAAFCITIIPLVGSVVFWIVATLLALFTGPMAAVIFALVYFTYMQIEAYVLTPRVMTRAVAVPGVLVVIGAMVGGTLLGLLGALVAVPVTASILLIVTEVIIPRQAAKTAPEAW